MAKYILTLISIGATLGATVGCTGGFRAGTGPALTPGSSVTAIGAASESSAAPASKDIDMWKVVTAFARRHPHEIKIATIVTGDAIVSEHTERMSGEKLIDRYDVGNGNFIDDVIVRSGDGIGFAATVGVVPFGEALYWDPYKFTSLILTVADAGVRYVTNISTTDQPIDSPVKHLRLDPLFPMPSGIDSFGVRDFGGTIGRRWYVRIAQRPIPADGVYPSDIGTNEISTWDLGPAEGEFDPEFGHLGYEQENRKEGSPTQRTFWGRVTPGEPASTFYGEYAYGSPRTVDFEPFALRAGESKTANGLTLLMQSEGNLVLYRGATVVWAAGGVNGTGINCGGACVARFQDSGNLVLYDGAGHAYWATDGNDVSGNRLRLSDGFPALSTIGTAGDVKWLSRPRPTPAEYQAYCVVDRAKQPWCRIIDSGAL